MGITEYAFVTAQARELFAIEFEYVAKLLRAGGDAEITAAHATKVCEKLNSIIESWQRSKHDHEQRKQDCGDAIRRGASNDLAAIS